MNETYWIMEIRTFINQFCLGPDKKHDDWKWREFLKMHKIMRAEQVVPTECLIRLICQQD